MSQENEKPTLISDYPVNLFEEPHGHVNQLGASPSSAEEHSEPHEEKHTRRGRHHRHSHDHANQWDMHALWPDRKPHSRDAK